ncbi:hypothetical protein RM190_23295, partial [Paracoccus sp. CPCC 101403]|nr:hypothetical protein [Paracoccus sp. CPCC 101403]
GVCLSLHDYAQVSGRKGGQFNQEYEKHLRDMQATYGEAKLELRARKKLADGIKVSRVRFCAWFGVPRGTPDGGVSTGLQQEHGATDIPADELAGAQAAHRPAPSRAMVRRPLPGLGRQPCR